MRQNPFKPTFGQMPAALAGRAEFIDAVLMGLANTPGDPNRATIFTGARGSGKTVLMHEIAERAESTGWLGIELTCAPGMLEEAIALTRARGAHLLAPRPSSQVTSLQVGPVAASREIVPAQTTWRLEMGAMVDELNAKGTGLLFTIDEVSPREDELKSFIVSYQHFVTEGKNVALMLAGLPSKVSLLLADDDVSFIRRAMQRELTGIDLIEVEHAMLRTIVEAGRQIEAPALSLAARATTGYAFMIQLVGYYLWQQHTEEETITVQDVEAAIAQAAHEMERAVFIPTLRELTRRETQFMYAMAEDSGTSTIAGVSERLGITQNNAVKLRKRLVEHGLVEDLGLGRLAFEMPLMADYLREHPWE